MPIHRFLENSSFGPDEVKVLVQAFEDALRTLNVDRDDPTASALAKSIIELATAGEHDPVRLRQRALQSVSQSH
jgi:hypothetical protein